MMESPVAIKNYFGPDKDFFLTAVKTRTCASLPPCA